jgi:hypothetical protein
LTANVLTRRLPIDHCKTKEHDMRITGWVLALASFTLTFGAIANAQSEQDKGKAATKVYAYKKTAPSTELNPGTARAARTETRDKLAEPAYGSPAWWRERTERFSGGEGGGSP